MERRLSSPIAAWVSPSETPNSLQSTRVDKERLRSNHAENKKRPTGNNSRNSSWMARLTQNMTSNAHEAKRWVSGPPPPLSSPKRKRPLRHPPGLPSLASPLSTHFHFNSSRQQPRHPKTNNNSRISESNDSPPSVASSGNSDSMCTAQKTALGCVDHASRRQTAAQVALTATSQIASSLKDLMGDSNRAVNLAQKSRIEAENAAVSAESSAKKVKEATDLAAKDKQRASLELDEANAQVEEAWEFLQRVKGPSKGKKKKDIHLKTKKETAKSAPIGTAVELCEDSYELNLPSVANESHSLSPRIKAGNRLSHIESIFRKNVKDIISKSHMKMPFQLDASPGRDSLIEPPFQLDASPGRDSLIEPFRSFKGHTSPVTHLAAVDQNRFISSSWDTTLRMWNADTGECLRIFRGHGDWVHAISVLDSKHFISGSDDRTIKLWNVDEEECIRTFKGHSSFVKALAPMDGDRFLSGSRDRTIKLFSVASGKCIQTFEGHTDVVSTMVALGSNHFASGSHDNDIKYWSDSSRTCVRTLVGHTGSIKTLTAISDNEIVSGSDDKMIRLWNVSTGQCLRKFGSNNSLVFSVAYICEGFFLSCEGNSIKLYHIPSGKCVKSYETPRISLAVVRLDDDRFVTGSDQMLYLWKF